MFDLIIQGGTVIDPGEGLNSKIDIAIKDGCIVNIQPNISSIKAKQSIDVTDKIVTPGLIDFHTHVYWGQLN